MYKTHQPKSDILRTYISEFTVLENANFKPINYYAFPHSVGAIFFVNDAEVTINQTGVSFTKNLKATPKTMVLGKFIEPLFLKYESAIDEIAINFTATGINYFFDKNYDQLAPAAIQFLDNETWNEFSKRLFSTSAENRIELLEEFLLSQLISKDLTKLESILEQMELDKSSKWKEISDNLKIPQRTINRMFHRYLGCSPKDFKKIIRFRSSIEMHTDNLNLTQLCLRNDYYDSPHFTNEFKRLTNKSPRDFFKNVEEIGNEKFPYIFT